MYPVFADTYLARGVCDAGPHGPRGDPIIAALWDAHTKLRYARQMFVRSEGYVREMRGQWAI